MSRNPSTHFPELASEQFVRVMSHSRPKLSHSRTAEALLGSASATALQTTTEARSFFNIVHLFSSQALRERRLSRTSRAAEKMLGRQREGTLCRKTPTDTLGPIVSLRCAERLFPGLCVEPSRYKESSAAVKVVFPSWDCSTLAPHLRPAILRLD